MNDPKDPRHWPDPQPMSFHFWALLWMAVYVHEHRFSVCSNDIELLEEKLDAEVSEIVCARSEQTRYLQGKLKKQQAQLNQQQEQINGLKASIAMLKPRKKGR